MVAQQAHTTISYFQARNIVFMGSRVIEGSGIGVVVATGTDTVVSACLVALSMLKLLLMFNSAVPNNRKHWRHGQQINED